MSPWKLSILFVAMMSAFLCFMPVFLNYNIVDSSIPLHDSLTNSNFVKYSYVASMALPFPLLVDLGLDYLNQPRHMDYMTERLCFLFSVLFLPVVFFICDDFHSKDDTFNIAAVIVSAITAQSLLICGSLLTGISETKSGIFPWEICCFVLFSFA